jgi:SAM-dependent methyltransferase
LPTEALTVAASDAERLHAEGVAAFEAGDTAAAADLLRRAALSGTDATSINDLAVVLSAQGEVDNARSLLKACLALDPGNEDALANLAQLDAVPAASVSGDWRRSSTLGGDDPAIPERAYPGMMYAGTMSEHATRYAFALGVLGGRRLLDVGCGTGYGSEMLTWSATSVRGFDLWQPAPHEKPQWPGGAELTYGFDVCRDPLPEADAAVMFEVLEHLDDAPAALRNVFAAVDTLMCSFPNPRYHGSHINHHHVNDWPLEKVEDELRRAVATRFDHVKMGHVHQPAGTSLLVEGRDPEAPFWIILAIGEGRRR